MSILDASSGKLPQHTNYQYRNHPDLMQPILRVNIQNQMYFEDLDMINMFRVSNSSRYLLLEFIASMSVIVVAN
jgi:hypothetical protein